MTAITSYATLQTAILEEAHRTTDADLTAVVPGLIVLAESRIYREMRVRQMETALSTAMSSGTLAVPSGYLELKFAYINGAPIRRLTKKDAEWIYANYPTRSADGTPSFIAREGENFIFGPYPDSDYTVKGIYYKRLAAVSTGSNWLITDAPDLILWASMCEVARWTQNDERLPIWERTYEQIKAGVQRQDADEEFSGSPLSVTAR